MNNSLRWPGIVLVGIVNLFRRHYPFLVVGGLLLQKADIKNFCMVVLALLLCHLTINLAQHYMALQKFQLMYQDFFVKAKKPIDSYKLSNYFNVEEIKKFFAMFGMNPYLKMFHRDINDAVCIIDSRSLGPELISDLVCISRPMFQSYIFIKQSPNQMMPAIEKLKIAHEVGHFALSPLYLSARRTGGLFLALIFGILVFRFVNLSAIPFWLKIFYGFILIIRSIDWVFLWLPTSLKDEMYADLFALFLLNKEEKNIVWQRFSSPRYKPELFFRNSKIIRPFTKRRTKMFMKNLQATLEENELNYIERTITNMEIPLATRFVISLFWCTFYFSFGFYLKNGLHINLIFWGAIDVIILLMVITLQIFNTRADRQLLRFIG